MPRIPAWLTACQQQCTQLASASDNPPLYTQKRMEKKNGEEKEEEDCGALRVTQQSF